MENSNNYSTLKKKTIIIISKPSMLGNNNNKIPFLCALFITIRLLKKKLKKKKICFSNYNFYQIFPMCTIIKKSYLKE
jgi:hypothetical protein